MRFTSACSLAVFLSFSPVPLSADYFSSDKYLYSIYVPARYKVKSVDNDFGPFLQFDHPDGDLFIHFWARKRPGSADTEFLRKAYENDFLKSFAAPPENPTVLKKEKNTLVYSLSVRILERPYQAVIYCMQRSNRFYVLSFYFPEGQEEKIREDMELVLYTLQYGE